MGIAGTVVILAAGQGKRMRSDRPKVLHELSGRPMLGLVLEQALALEPERVILVVGHGADEVRRWVEERSGVPGVRFVTQHERLGTGHAVLQCQDELRGAPGPVVILYGDMPLLRTESLRRLCATQRRATAALLVAEPAETRGFGRILRDERGAFRGIVEERDASETQRAIREVNVGVYAFEAAALLRSLPLLSKQNAQGEYYLTDVLRILLDDGERVETVRLADEREAIGINTPDHLAEAQAVVDERAGAPNG